MSSNNARFRLVGASAVILLAAGALALTQVGCARSGRGAGAPKPGGALVVALAAAPDSLNVYLARLVQSLLVANRVLPRLAREVLPDEGQAGGLTPELAQSWAFSDQGRTLTLKLKDGRWSDGTAIGCADLQYTLTAQTNADVAWRGASLKRHITAIECPDPRTAIVRFDQAHPTRLMDVNDAHILPRSLAAIPFTEWRRTDWATRLPAGGAFKIAQASSAQEIVLERNRGWFGGPDSPRLERLVLRVIPDANSRVTQLLAGDVDVVDELSPVDAARLTKQAAVRVLRRPGWSYTYLGWNTLDREAYARFQQEQQADCRRRGATTCAEDAATVARLAARHPHPLFGDARVRRAMTLAIDRQELVDAFFGGEADVPASPILAPLPEHDPDLAPWPCDPAQAKRLLAEAGFVDADGDGTLDRRGRPFVFELGVQAGSRLRKDVAALIQQRLAKVGVGVQLTPIENSAFYATIAARKVDAWIGGWPVSLRVEMNEVLHADGCGAGGQNFGAYSNPTADALASQARDTADDQARARAWHSWERLFHEDQPYTILFRPRRLIGVRARVQGADSMLSNDVLSGVENWWLEDAPGR